MAEGGPEEDVLLLLVLVTREKLLLLGVEKPHHIPLSPRTTGGKEGLAREESKEERESQWKETWRHTVPV